MFVYSSSIAFSELYSVLEIHRAIQYMVSMIENPLTEVPTPHTQSYTKNLKLFYIFSRASFSRKMELMVDLVVESLITSAVLHTDIIFCFVGTCRNKECDSNRLMVADGDRFPLEIVTEDQLVTHIYSVYVPM